MAELVHVMRGDIVESKHRGDIVVVNSSGEVLAYLGDPFLKTYLRSSAKPIQALNVVISGAAEKFGLSQKEISIMCASHYGEDFHRSTVLDILKKIGMSVENLQCGSPMSINSEYNLKLVAQGHKFNQLNSDCSGKHSGFLATCRAKSYPTEDYNRPAHPLQKDITKVISEMCEVPVEKIAMGEDGCGAPVHGMPLYNMALGFAKLANPGKLPTDYKNACEKIFQAMNAAPEMLAGSGGFCTELVKHTNGKLCAKLGAEAVYCVGVKGMDIGIAMKIEDGNYSRALNVAVMSVLSQLKILSDAETMALSGFARPENVNHHRRKVGEILPIFKLKML